MPSETIYIAGFTIFLSGVLCLLGGVPIVGVPATLSGIILWGYAWYLRNAEIRNQQAFDDAGFEA